MIPKGVTEILYFAFTESRLRVVKFEANSQLVSIGYGTFANTNLISIAIPKGVAQFDDWVFYGTPCPDKSVFKPGNAVVDCKIDACVNLKKETCKNRCVFTKTPKRLKVCLPKKKKFEHDCAQHKGRTPCLKAEVCKFSYGRCVHRCDGKRKLECRKAKFCKTVRAANPCYGCQLVTTCGSSR